jgi:hypothetical protein
MRGNNNIITFGVTTREVKSKSLKSDLRNTSSESLEPVASHAKANYSVRSNKHDGINQGRTNHIERVRERGEHILPLSFKCSLNELKLKRKSLAGRALNAFESQYQGPTREAGGNSSRILMNAPRRRRSVALEAGSLAQGGSTA